MRRTRGAVYDVVIDLRPGSPTFTRRVSENLTGANYRMLYIPAGCAHGFQSLEDHSEITYQMSASYHPAAEAGVR